MTEMEVARIVGELAAVLVAMVAAGRWLLVYLWRIIHKVDALTEQVRQINSTVAHLTEENREQRELNAWFAGKIGEPLPARRHKTEEGC